MFDHLRADLRSYGGRFGAQGFWVMVVYRFGRWRYGVRPLLLRKLVSLLYRAAYKVVQVLTGIELPCEVEVGRNFVIDHFGGIVVSGFAKFGDNCAFGGWPAARADALRDAVATLFAQPDLASLKEFRI